MACRFSEPVLESQDGIQGELCRHDVLSSPPNFQCAREPTKENPALHPALEKSNAAYSVVMESTANTLRCISASADLDLRKNTEYLEERGKEVANWQGEIQALISKLREEIVLLDGVRKRLERALTALQTPEAIVAECLARRVSRCGHDLLPDQVDAVLEQEQRLCKDIRDLFNLTMTEIESQLETDKVCKIQLEFDWSDKNEAYRLETVNIGLRKKGPISFYPGATRMQANQSTPEHWLHYTKEQVSQGQIVLQRSAALRKRTEESLARAAADLRTQANTVELSLERNIAETIRSLQEAEESLNTVLSQISVAETLHGKLTHILREVDINLKTSQTRLANRAARPRAENTRDCVQKGLIDEVVHLNQDASCIKQEMESADSALQSLYHSRALLEDKIAVKRKSLYIDRDRCMVSRTKFPDSTTLTGF